MHSPIDSESGSKCHPNTYAMFRRLASHVSTERRKPSAVDMSSSTRGIEPFHVAIHAWPPMPTPAPRRVFMIVPGTQRLDSRA